MKICPYCGRNNQDEEKICKYCHAGFPHDEVNKNDKPVEEEQPSERVLRKRTRR